MNRLLLSFLVAGTALGGNAFKNVESHTTVKSGNALPSGYIVQQTDNRYIYVSTTTGDDGQCDIQATKFCKYTVPAENSIPTKDSYTEEELQNFGLSPSNNLQRVWTPPGAE